MTRRPAVRDRPAESQLPGTGEARQLRRQFQGSGPRVVLAHDAGGPLRGLDLATGRQLWESAAAGRLGGDRLDDRDVAVLGDAVAAWSPGDDGSGRVAVLAAVDGRERWVSKAGSGDLVAVGDGWFATVSSTDVDGADLWFYEVTG